MTCKYLGCDAEPRTKGVCGYHYGRQRRVATMEWSHLVVGLRHGTRTGYADGCRCEPCRHWNPTADVKSHTTRPVGDGLQRPAGWPGTAWRSLERAS